MTMTKKPFREHHLLLLMEHYENSHLPLDCCIADYFRAHKALGSKDRAYIADTAYSLVRWLSLLDYHLPNKKDWEARLSLYQTLDLQAQLNDETIPLHIRYCCPKILFDLLVASYGTQRACELCLINNERAPATVRANTLKISRDALYERWKEANDISLCPISPDGLVFNKTLNFFTLPEFKQGFFEVQDEGSQILAHLVQAKPGELVLDYCAGAGGKSLAIAATMQHKGQLFLHDIRKQALQDAKKRLKRAGIQNAQIVLPESSQLKALKKKMDWVLVDAPCSGTGTLRRNPDMKWRFDEETMPKLIGLQRTIFEKALSFLKPNGRIVYATCSLLNEENQLQVEHFIRTYGLTLEYPPFQSWPSKGGMDGFFGAVLKKTVQN